MVRYLSSKLKKLSRFNLHIHPGFTTKYCLFKRDIKFNKVIVSFFLLELIEKQKLKFTFSLRERLLKKYVKIGRICKKFNLWKILKSRIDSVLFDLGFVVTLAQARQLISHGYVFVNFVVVSSPSFLLKKGDIIVLGNFSDNVFKICKKNLYKKYLKKIKSSGINVSICYYTLTCVILALYNFNYFSTYCYNTSYIYNMYCR